MRPHISHSIPTHTQQTTQQKQTPTDATYVRTTYVSRGPFTTIVSFPRCIRVCIRAQQPTGKTSKKKIGRSQDTCVRKRKNRHMYGQKPSLYVQKHTSHQDFIYIQLLLTRIREPTSICMRLHSFHIVPTHTHTYTQQKQTPADATSVRTTYVSGGPFATILSLL